MTKTTDSDVTEIAGGADVNEAVAFLEAFHPGGPWHLVAIIPDGLTIGRTFLPNQREQLLQWLSERNGKANLYFHVNSLKMPPKSGKAKKEDVREAGYLHADIDNTRPETLARLQQWRPRFTAIVASGGGYHAYHKLSKPSDDFELVEECNKALVKIFSGDSGTHNVDRILRLPGTINLPNDKKRQAGRTDTLARLVEAEWTCAYNLELLHTIYDSEHLPGVTRGDKTHDPALRFIGQLANVSDDDGLITEIVMAALPKGYGGDTPKEISELIKGARDKLATGVWTKPYTGDAPTLSEEHLAQEFAARYGNDVRHVSKGLGWMVWDGARWRDDDKRLVFRRARVVCQELSRRARKQQARSIASAKTRAAVVSLAQDDERIAATVDQWDADPWLLGSPGGAIDLRTGELRPPVRNDYITKITAVAPDWDCPIPLWMAFLERVTASDQELQAYLQRVNGYLLTGVTDEHALFFLYGSGANGKSVFIRTTTGIVHEYHRPVPIEALMWSRNERHPTDLAGLRGARIGSAVEIDEGRNWDEPKIMQLTGGDMVTARLMRQDFFDFIPQFKLMIAGNHKPGLRSVNEAIRRRLHLVPFTVTIPEGERDLQLGEKLKVEWPGILAWMITGCLLWQQHGLAAPAAVVGATDEYLATQDTLQQWIEECCEVGSELREESSILFGSWQHWQDQHGERRHPHRAFNHKLEGKDFRRSRDKHGVWVHGLQLNEDERAKQEERDERKRAEREAERQ